MMRTTAMVRAFATFGPMPLLAEVTAASTLAGSS
jgi:hypothetical protein